MIIAEERLGSKNDIGLGLSCMGGDCLQSIVSAQVSNPFLRNKSKPGGTEAVSEEMANARICSYPSRRLAFSSGLPSKSADFGSGVFFKS